MADDLVSNKKLIGLARQEVVARLGEPPKTEYFKEFDLVYYLGPERGFISIDSEWLLLNLGPDGRVQRELLLATKRHIHFSGNGVNQDLRVKQALALLERRSHNRSWSRDLNDKNSFSISSHCAAALCCERNVGRT